jgi:hypothetical protein
MTFAGLAIVALVLVLSVPASGTLWSKVLTVSGSVHLRPRAFQGCGVGFWKQPHHFDTWPAAYATSTPFEGVFGREVPDDPTLLEALEQGGGQLIALMRHATAALLNAASPEVEYPLREEEVIAKFQAAFDSGDYEPTAAEFEAANEADCPLNSGAGLPPVATETPTPTATETAPASETPPTTPGPSATPTPTSDDVTQIPPTETEPTPTPTLAGTPEITPTQPGATPAPTASPEEDATSTPGP